MIIRARCLIGAGCKKPKNDQSVDCNRLVMKLIRTSKDKLAIAGVICWIDRDIFLLPSPTNATYNQPIKQIVASCSGSIWPSREVVFLRETNITCLQSILQTQIGNWMHQFVWTNGQWFDGYLKWVVTVANGNDPALPDGKHK